MAGLSSHKSACGLGLGALESIGGVSSLMQLRAQRGPDSHRGGKSPNSSLTCYVVPFGWYSLRLSTEGWPG